MGIVFVKKNSVQTKTMDERSGSFRELNKLKFLKNERKKNNLNRSNELKTTIVFFTQWTNFPKDLKKTIAKLNERFYLTNEFTERSFSEKMKEIVVEYYPSSNFYKGSQ